MGQTQVYEQISEHFYGETGEITRESKTVVNKSEIGVTDEFVKVSKYLNLIFAYNSIPLKLVPISLIFAQRMEFKTNTLLLFREDKEEIAEMMDVSIKRVDALVTECKKYDIIRPTRTRGKYVVNGYLYSTGSIGETRNLQAYFDIENGLCDTQGAMINKITGECVRKSVTNRSTTKQKGIPGQMELDFGKDGVENDSH